MWATSLPEDACRRIQAGENQENPWHHNDEIQRVSDQGEDSGDRTAAIDSLPAETEDQFSGTWGERDTGIESTRTAMQDFEALRQELTALSRSSSHRPASPSLFRTVTERSARSVRQTRDRISSDRRSTSAPPRRPKTPARDGQRLRTASPLDRWPGMEDLEKTEEEETDLGATEIEDSEDEFELEQFMREGHFEKRVEGRSAKKVGVLWKDLTVKGIGSTAVSVKTLPDAIIGTFGPDLYKIIMHFFPRLKLRRHARTRTLINKFSGVVRDGEMMLVLGRPGSGCSTFLKAIANNRESFAEVTGEVSYGGISADKQKKHFRGEVNYNPEDDKHFASLDVWQTLKFSLMNKTKKREKGEIPIIINALLRIFGISHTKYTLIGDEYIRGVSGGERKRVSIAETLAGKSTVVCWDNSTRGLDSSTALDYAKSLRVMTDISNRTTFVTLYQAGEGIYELMDKVMVIDSGRFIFQGPAKDAKAYFVNLGYACPDRQTTADFLTAVTDPNERRFRQGFAHSAPKGPEELERAYLNSTAYQKVLQDMQDYEQYLQQTDFGDAKEFQRTAHEQKSKTVSKRSSYTVSFVRQVQACTVREFWLIFGDTTTLITKFIIIISNGLIVGSLFYGQSLNTEGAFSRGGTVFFSILFLGWLQLSELMKAVSGRAVVARHKDYAFYRPSAVAIARVITDFPMLLLQVVIFCIIMYFMTNLDVNISKFWIYLLFVYTTTICVTALYRMFASLSPTIDDAVRFSGLALNLLIIYTGYVIPKPQLIGQYIWFGWLYYVNPVGYSFEAVISNEFAGRTMECAPEQLVPQGPGVDPAYQGCALPGAAVNAQSVPGSQYLQTNYTYTRAHLWRNFGVIIAFTVLYILVTVIATELFSITGSGGGALVFKKGWKSRKALQKPAPVDEEKGLDYGESPTSGSSEMELEQRLTASGQTEKEALKSLAKSDSVFTWKDVDYTVPYRGGEKKLLNKVSGYAKPGKMVALIGASGAGKTTLLNTLSQRQTIGVVGGEFLVDGKELGHNFQRGTGFCEQMDLHDGAATIREALEFSAMLRQDASVQKFEKIAYVDNIIDLLELSELQDAIISSLGVEQRRRLTIGVELAAKPELLLFLDEPTSGLDSNSAYSIVRFLRKLAQAGQAIICTIHQPSSVLIQQFDMILALNPGGNVFYFGLVGDNGEDVIRYFADRGRQCPPNKNIAEFILETAAKRRTDDGRRVNWNEEWRNSDQQEAILAEIDRIKAERSRRIRKPENGESDREFAAPMWLQTTLLTKRIFIQYWRDPSYLYGKLFVSVVIGIFVGFTFWQLGYSVQDMQNRMFSAFLILVFPPTIVNAVVPKFYTNMALWQSRELPSRIYGWIPFCTAMVVAEIPITIVGSVIYWLLWYFPAGLPTDSSTAGYVFLMTMLFFLFQASWGQWICAFAPSFTVISNVLPFFFVMFALFNGVVRPFGMLPVFWKYWMYYVNPSTYWISGVLAATLHNLPVLCTPEETARFDAPPAQTCGSYAGAFANSTGGYLLNPEASSGCMFCQYSVGDQYLATLNVEASQKWRDFGIFLAFCISNWALVYFFIYTVRIKGWSFGFGTVFDVIEKVVGKMKVLFFKTSGEEEVE